MKITLPLKMYPLEAVLNASYMFIDRAYIRLDTNKKGDRIEVFFKPKGKISAKKLASFKGEFMNELLHSSLRYTVSKANKKMREYIIGRALYAGLPAFDSFTPNEELDYKDDPLGIAVPWEEKYGRKRVKNKV